MANNFRIDVIAELNVAVSTENIQKQLNSMKGLTVKVDKIDFGKGSLDSLEAMSRNLSSIFSTIAAESLQGSKGFAELNKSIDSVNNKAKTLKKTLTSIGSVPGVVQLAEQIQLAQRLIGQLDKSSKDAKSSMKGLVATTKQLKQTTKTIKGGFAKDLIGVNIDKEINKVIKLKNEISSIQKSLGANIGPKQTSFLSGTLRDLNEMERVLQAAKSNKALDTQTRVNVLASQRAAVESAKTSLKKEGLLGNTAGLKFDTASINNSLTTVRSKIESLDKLKIQPKATGFMNELRELTSELNLAQREFSALSVEMNNATGSKAIQELNARFDATIQKMNVAQSRIKLLTQEIGTGFKIANIDQVNKVLSTVNKTRQQMQGQKNIATSAGDIEQIQKEILALDNLEQHIASIKSLLSNTSNMTLLARASTEFLDVEAKAAAATAAAEKFAIALKGNASIKTLATNVNTNVGTVNDDQRKLREFNMKNGYLDDGKMGKKASNLIGDLKKYEQAVGAFNTKLNALNANSTAEQIMAVRTEAEKLAATYNNLQARKSALFNAANDRLATGKAANFTVEDTLAQRAKLEKRLQQLNKLSTEPASSKYTEQIAQEKIAIEQEISALDRLAATRKKLNSGAGVGKANNDWNTSKQRVKGIGARIDTLDTNIVKSGITGKSFESLGTSLNGGLKALTGLESKGVAIDKVKGSIQSLIAKVGELNAKMNSGDATSIRSARQEYDALKTSVHAALAEVEKLKSQGVGTKTTGQLAKEVGSFEKTYRNRIAELGSINKKYLGSTGDQASVFSTSSTLLTSYNNQLNSVTAALGRYKAAKTSADQQSARDSLMKEISAFKALEDEYNKLILKEKEYKNAKNIDMGYNKAIDRVTSLYGANKTAINGSTEALGKYRDILNGLNSRSIPFSDINSKVLEFQAYLNKAGLTVDNFGTRLKKAFASKILSQFSYMGWMMVMTSMRKLYTNVVSVDTAMTELRKVTDATASEYNAFLEGAEERAKSLGATMTETINATADWARLGYSMEEASRLADASLIYQNVGDDVESIDEASSSLISTLQGFGMASSDVMTIVDEFNEVANNFPTSAGDIGEGLKRSASSLAVAGNSLEESIALFTAGQSVVQDADSLGTMLKTTTMRLRGAKTELEDAGLETDGMAVSTSKLREEVMALTGGFDIMADAAGTTFKSTYDILKGVSEHWDSMADVSQASLLELLAGKRNGNALSAIIKNFDMAEDALQTAQNAAGSASRENEIYLQSIQGKIDQFKATWESFSKDFLGSDVIKSTITAFTTILDLIDRIATRLGSMPSILAASLLTATRLGKLQVFNPNGNNTLSSVWGNTKTNAEAVKSRMSTFFTGGVTNTSTLTQEQIGLVQKYNAEIDKNGKVTSNAKNIAKGFNSELKATKAYANGTKIVLKDLTDGTGTVATGMQTAAKASKLVAGVGNVLASAAGAIAVGAILSGVVKLTNYVIKLADHTEEAEFAINAYNEAMSKSESNSKTVNDIADDFNRLAKGVDDQGHNISLTNAEYEQYKNHVQSIIDIYPELVQGYNREGQAIVNRNTLIQDAIKLQEEYNAAARSSYLASGDDIVKSTHEKLGDAGKKGRSITWDLLSDSNINAALQSAEVLSSFRAEREPSKSDQFNTRELEDIINNKEKVITAYKEIRQANGDTVEDINAGVAALRNSISDASDYLQERKNIIGEGVDWLRTKIQEESPESLSLLPESLQFATDDLLFAFYERGSNAGKTANEIFNETTNALGQLGEKLTETFSKDINLNDDISSLQDYIDAIDELKKSAGSGAITTEEYTKAATKLKESMYEQADAVESSDEVLAELLDTMADTIAINYSDVVDEISEAFNPLADKIKSATKAKEEFDSAMEASGDFSDGITAYKNILDEIFGDDKYHAEGKGDRTFWQAANQVLGEDRVKELDFNVDKVYNEMKKLKKAFASPNKAAQQFFDLLKNNKKLLEDKNLGTINLDKNGNLKNFELDNEKWKQIADVLNISEETLAAMVENARQFSNINWFDPKELKNAVKASGLAREGSKGKLYIDKDEMYQQSGALNQKEFEQSAEAIKKADIVMIDLKADAKETAEAFLDIGKTSGVNLGTIKSMDFENTIAQMQGMGYSAKEIYTWLSRAKKDGVGFNKQDFTQEDVDSIYTRVQNDVAQLDSIDIMSDDQVVNALNNMSSSIDTLVAVLGGLPPKIGVSADQIEAVGNQIADLEGTDVDSISSTTKESLETTLASLTKVQGIINEARKAGIDDTEIKSKYGFDPKQLDQEIELLQAYLNGEEIEVPVSFKTEGEQELQAVLDENSVANVENTINSLADGTVTIKAKDEATGEAQRIHDGIGGTFGVPVEQNVKIGGNAETEAKSLWQSIKDIFGTPLYQKIEIRKQNKKGETTSSPSVGINERGILGGRKLFGSNAGGTRKARYGLSLTGELGPELVWNRKNNQSYLVGEHGPELASLDKGDVVYTAEETKRILKGNKHEIWGSHAAGGGIESTAEKYVTHKDDKDKKKSDKSSKKENKEVTNRLDELIKRLETVKGYTAKNQKAFLAALKDAKAKGQIDKSEYDKYKKQYGNIKAGKIVDLFNADKKTYKKAAAQLKKYAKAGKIEWSDYYGYIDKLNEHRIEKNEEAYKEEDKSYKKAVAYAKKRYKKGQISAEQYYSTLESINDEHYSRIIANNTKKVEHGLKTQKAAISALKKLNKQGKISTKELNEALEDLQEAAKDYAQSIIDDAERIIDRWETFSLREYTINTNGVKIDTSGFKELYQEMTNLQKWGLSKYANDALSGGLKTQFGNIDTNNREVIEWTKKNIEKYSKAAKSWGEKLYEGSYSTIDGRSESFNYKTTKTDKNGKKTTAWKHAEIAFSPLLQTGTGEPEFLNADTVHKYIEKIVQQAANKDGGKLKASTVFELDKKGLTIEGKKISNLIASVGKNAIDEGSLMHFAGDNGGIADSYRNIEAAAKDAGVSVKALTEYWNNSNPAKQIDYEAYKKWKEAIGEVVDETKDFSRRIRTAVDVWNDALKRLKKEAGRGQIDGVAYAEKVQEIYANIAKAQRELILDQKDQMRDLIDSVADMLKQQNDDQIDALNKEKDAWSDIIALKRKSLELTKEETQHQDQLADYTKQLADLQKQAQTLSLDDSREGKAKYADVQNQIAEVQQEMLRYQRDYSLDQAGNMLDDLDDAYGKYIEDQTETLSKVFETQGDLIERAIAYIGSKDLPTLEKELIAWNHDNGTGYEADIKDKFYNLNGVLFDYIQNDKISKANILAILEKALSTNMGVSNSYVDAQGKTQYFDISDGSGIDDSKSAGNQITQLLEELKKNDEVIRQLKAAGVSDSDDRINSIKSANGNIVEEIEAIAAASTSASLKSTYANGAIGYDGSNYTVNGGKTLLVDSKSDNTHNTADYLINKAKNVGKVTTRYKDPEKKTGVSTGYAKLNEIAAELATIGGYSGVGVYLDSKAGAYKLKNNGKFLWHTGLAKGFVGGKNSVVPVDQNEVYRLLTKDELVLNKNDQLRLGAQLEMLGKFMETFDTSKTATKDAGKVLNNTANIELSINSPVTITGNADSATVAQLEAYSQKTAKLALGELEGALNRSGFKVSAASNAFKK